MQVMYILLLNKGLNTINKIIYILFLVSMCWTQWYGLNHDFVSRIYYVSYPQNVGTDSEVPLIINMHGYGSDALSQRFYSEMDEFAHAQGIAVVYPQGAPNNINTNSWNIGAFWDGSNLDDVGFISQMIDQINQNFNIDLDRVYACGMSNGGYMAYELACELEDKIAAFGSVTGNFMLNTNQTCDFTREVPIAHFHGTSDSIVDYYEPTFDGSLAVDEAANYWIQYNDFDLEFVGDLNNNVEIYKYYKENSSAEFLHYKVYEGGHDWFKEDWGFHTSQELINFFLNYRLSDFLYNYEIGDINYDDEINVLDVILLAEMILNETYLEQGDINQDQTISILDIIALINLILFEN
jgi:polyhydroxybutyrate depolymerase